MKETFKILDEVKSNNLKTIAQVEANGRLHKFESKPYDAGDIKSLEDAVNKLDKESLDFIKKLLAESPEHYIMVATTSNYLVEVNGELAHNQRELKP